MICRHFAVCYNTVLFGIQTGEMVFAARAEARKKPQYEQMSAWNWFIS